MICNTKAELKWQWLIRRRRGDWLGYFFLRALSQEKTHRSRNNFTTCSSLCAIVRQRLSRHPLNCLLNVRITSSFVFHGSFSSMNKGGGGGGGEWQQNAKQMHSWRATGALLIVEHVETVGEYKIAITQLAMLLHYNFNNCFKRHGRGGNLHTNISSFTLGGWKK